jgi:2-methylisocitrate lyase-like PEP mutase family enzyme
VTDPAPHDLSDRADRLLALHVPGAPLVLPNVWDVPSAVAVSAARYPAVATSSAAVAGALGYDDNNDAPVAEMFAAAARIAKAIDVPLTVDAEAGYGLTPADLVDALLSAGAVGCNLEDTDHLTDGLRDTGAQVDYLAGVRAAAQSAGVHMVINARIDVFLHGSEPPAELLDAAVRRALRYAEAGADCVYPILLHEPAVAHAFCAAVAPLPVNLLGSYSPAAGRITLADARTAGAARISFGPDLWRAATKALQALIPPLY